MAFEEGTFTGGHLTLPAAADLSGSQYRFVAVNSGGNAALCGVDAQAIGVLQNKPTATQAASIMTTGASKVIADGTVAAGAKVSASATAGAVTTGTGAVLGIALTGGVINQIITVELSAAAA